MGITVLYYHLYVCEMSAVSYVLKDTRWRCTCNVYQSIPIVVWYTAYIYVYEICLEDFRCELDSCNCEVQVKVIPESVLQNA